MINVANMHLKGSNVPKNNPTKTFNEELAEIGNF